MKLPYVWSLPHCAWRSWIYVVIHHPCPCSCDDKALRNHRCGSRVASRSSIPTSSNDPILIYELLFVPSRNHPRYPASGNVHYAAVASWDLLTTIRKESEEVHFESWFCICVLFLPCLSAWETGEKKTEESSWHLLYSDCCTVLPGYRHSRVFGSMPIAKL